MCKCKKANEAVNYIKPAKASVTVNVDVTNIVKYVSIAGVAVVGIIFGAKSYIEYIKSKKEAQTKDL
jgi:hypothetical protein